MEIRPVPSAPEYGVTRDGRVFRLTKPRNGRVAPYELIPHAGKRGYLTVAVHKVTTPVHRLVAETYLPNPDGLPEVAHNNGQRHDNRHENLRWATRKENNDDRFDHGTVLRGEEVPSAKLSASDIPRVRAGLAAGELQREVAERFGVSRRCIGKIATRDTWRHV